MSYHAKKKYKKFCVFTAVPPAAGIHRGLKLSESTILSFANLSSMTVFAQLYDVVSHELGRMYHTTWVLDAGPVVFESTTHPLTNCCFCCCLDILCTESYS